MWENKEEKVTNHLFLVYKTLLTEFHRILSKWRLLFDNNVLEEKANDVQNERML